MSSCAATEEAGCWSWSVVACRADVLFLLCLLFESARSPVPAHCPHSHASGPVVFMALCTRCLCGSFGWLLLCAATAMWLRGAADVAFLPFPCSTYWIEQALSATVLLGFYTFDGLWTAVRCRPLAVNRLHGLPCDLCGGWANAVVEHVCTLSVRWTLLEWGSHDGPLVLSCCTPSLASGSL